MNEMFDTVVIGAGVNGLTAAAYLARAGKRVLVTEAEDTIGGLCQPFQFADGFLCAYVAHAIYGLDPRILKDFKSVRKGLAFAARDLPLAGFAEDDRPMLLVRDVHASARSIAVHSQSDARAWPRFHAEFFCLARAMRRLWWEDTAFDPTRLSRANQAALSALQTMSAAAWLDSWFESGLLKAILAFDIDGASLLEPGSALTLLWRAAQEVCGLQGAVAIPQRSAGAVTKLVGEAAASAGAVIRSGTRVERLLVEADGIAGVELGYRETVSCRNVLSSLSRRNTLLGLAMQAASFAEARDLRHSGGATGSALVAFALDKAPKFHADAIPAEARLITASDLETVIAAEGAARAGQLADDPVFEILAPSLSDATVAPPGGHVVTCLVRPVPLQPSDGWNVVKPKLTAKVIRTLDRLSPGLVPTIVSVHTTAPDEAAVQSEVSTPARMLSSWRERIRTSIPGLFLCGVSADPVASVSGRAGRIAAFMALERE